MSVQESGEKVKSCALANEQFDYDLNTILKIGMEIEPTLDGRFMIVNIYPYSFNEFLSAMGKDKNYLGVISTKDRAEVLGLYDQYVKYGAFRPVD